MNQFHPIDCSRRPHADARPLGHMALAMAYVPWQHFTNTYDPEKALHVGTIFPELDKPYIGKRGMCR